VPNSLGGAEIQSGKPAPALGAALEERRSLSKQDLISAATKVDPDGRYYIGRCREKNKRYERAASEGDPMCRFGLEMKKSQKEGLNEVVGTLIEACGKGITPDIMILAISEWIARRNEQ
jgi:hypothetical protein